MSSSSSSSQVVLDLNKINNKLQKHGQQPLKALFGVGNCAICYGAKEVVEWSLLVPCGHIVCTECMKKMRDAQNTNPTNLYFNAKHHIVDGIKCPLCNGVGKAFRLIKSNYDVDRHKSRSLNPPTSSDVIPLGPKSSTIMNSIVGGANYLMQILSARQQQLPQPPNSATIRLFGGLPQNQLYNASISQSQSPLPVRSPSFGRSSYTRPSITNTANNYKKNLPPLSKSTENLQEDLSTLALTYCINNDNNKGVVKLTHIDLSTTQTPLDIVLLFDVSGSMTSYFKSICIMAKEFVDLLSPDDRFSMITFSSVTTQPFALQPATRDAKVIMKRCIEQNNDWGSSTNLQMGVQHALNVIKDGQVSGRTMYFILVTDGIADGGYEGRQELKEILEIPNLAVKMCTFGGHIDANILTDVLEHKIQDYVHLQDPSDFANMIKSIGLNKLQVVADNILLSVKLFDPNGSSTSISSLSQLKRGEQIIFPFFVHANKPCHDVIIDYVNPLGDQCQLIGINNTDLFELIEMTHNKNDIGAKIMIVLENIKNLRSNYELLNQNVLQYNEFVKGYKSNINDIKDLLKTLNVGEYKAEILQLIESVDVVITQAENDPNKFAHDSNSSNSSSSMGYNFMSSKSTHYNK